MRLIQVDLEQLKLGADLVRTRRTKIFEERLRASIDEMGLAEPLKVAPDPRGGYVIIDGVLRYSAILLIHAADQSRFQQVPALLMDYDRRFEVRFQSDIYQDLLPSQLASLVEHLHLNENILKSDIARYIGVSPATLRNYTGLWRLIERGGLFARIVELMDTGVLPASNPYAWLRLTEGGIRVALIQHFSAGGDPDSWIDEQIEAALRGRAERVSIKTVEEATSSLPADCYRTNEDVRTAKRDLGLLRAKRPDAERGRAHRSAAKANLASVRDETRNPVLRHASESLLEYLT